MVKDDDFDFGFDFLISDYENRLQLITLQYYTKNQRYNL